MWLVVVVCFGRFDVVCFFLGCLDAYIFRFADVVWSGLRLGGVVVDAFCVGCVYVT